MRAKEGKRESKGEKRGGGEKVCECVYKADEKMNAESPARGQFKVLMVELKVSVALELCVDGGECV